MAKFLLNNDVEKKLSDLTIEELLDLEEKNNENYEEKKLKTKNLKIGEKIFLRFQCGVI